MDSPGPGQVIFSVTGTAGGALPLRPLFVDNFQAALTHATKSTNAWVRTTTTTSAPSPLAQVLLALLCTVADMANVQPPPPPPPPRP
eukprot:COSAG01_NODE_51726_length_352_cov_1.142292_1_plen_86_part_10